MLCAGQDFGLQLTWDVGVGGSLLVLPLGVLLSACSLLPSLRTNSPGLAQAPPTRAGAAG